MKKRLRVLISIFILIITATVFSLYISKHLDLIRELRHIKLEVLIGILLLYILWFFSLVLVFKISMRVCKKSIPPDESLLLNGYSTIVNFFVLGQSGPAVRALYLYKKYRLRIRVFLLVTLLYYVSYAIISTSLLLIPSKVWWLTFPIVAVILSLAGIGSWFYIKRSKILGSELSINATNVTYLFFATLLQVFILTLIYYVELKAVNSHLLFKQVIMYTGVANLTLFVSLTPGGIGIRESLLIFSEHLHKISSANIVSASIIDRSIFLLLLTILFIVIISLHAKKRLFGKQNISTNNT
ncbi:MAG TPA: lysylphosphatidylglycerol synthase domain-containing protein, partial [Candidatus Saccharimonadia bacterium]|nr:lysylphosphatidylglycerol synthase domain-containing protein [Candidatus Saccharimonadia bacterium]